MVINMETLDERLLKERKLLGLFEQVAKLIDNLEQYFIQKDGDDVKKTKSDIEMYLGAIRGVLKKDEKFFRKHLREIIARDKISKKQVKSLPRLSHDAVSGIDKLIGEINDLMKLPEENTGEKIIDKISKLVENIKKFMQENIALVSKLN